MQLNDAVSIFLLRAVDVETVTRMKLVHVIAYANLHRGVGRIRDLRIAGRDIKDKVEYGKMG